MRILLLSPRISGVGGIAQHVRKLGSILAKHGHEVEIIAVETMGLRLPKGLANPGYSVISAAHVASRKYDIAHGHNLPAAIPLKFVRAETRILTLHGVYSRQIRLLYGDLLGRAAAIAEKILLAGIDAITAVSLDAVRYYRSIGYDVAYIPNAIDLSDMPSSPIRLMDPQIIYLGRLSKEKGVDLLVQAAAKGLKGLVIAGDGPLKPLIEKAARKKLLKYLGPLPRWKALRVLAGSDALILPSREEGVSTSLLEAMALRIPIIATKVGGTADILNEGSGILINPDPAEIIKAARRILENRDEARKLAERAHKKLLSAYTWDKVHKLYLHLYDKLLLKKSPPKTL